MRNLITISDKKIATTTCKIRNLMTGIGTHLWRHFLDARFLLQQLAGMATAQRVVVPVYRRRSTVGVMRRSSAPMGFAHLHRATGHSGGPGSVGRGL